MTRRSQQPDTDADRELYSCLNSKPPKSFLMIAGAGSGKTTSLIKGLTEILTQHGEQLLLHRQQVACITYTEIAAAEIWADVGNNPLVRVSTIHSFLWSLVRPFHSDIKAWVAQRLEVKIKELKDTAAAFGPRVQQRTRVKNQSDLVRLELQRSSISKLQGFSYGTGSDYASGILGHDDILRMVPQLIVENPLMRKLLMKQYPFLFVDESQDTTENVVTALKAVDRDHGNEFCLGFFGDPMQQIYPIGIGEIEPEGDWRTITKPENFRCSGPVLSLANAIRSGGDGLVQTRGGIAKLAPSAESAQGTARIFILPIDKRRDERIAQTRQWLAAKNQDPVWLRHDAKEGVKVLVIVHRMAARRLGFAELYASMNDSAPDKFKSGFLDGTAWPLQPFRNFVLPLLRASQEGRDLDVMQLLRARSPLLSRISFRGEDISARLSKLDQAVESLKCLMMPASKASIAEVLRLLNESELAALDPRILAHLELTSSDNSGATTAEEQSGDDLAREVTAMEAFLACPASQFWSYCQYIDDESPFSTQQGIKGAEFERVLVVLDDEEGTHVQFSYDKYLGLKALSERDLQNRQEGKETTVERTRRLFYVCCTRALSDLVVVLFTHDVPLAQEKLRLSGLFPRESIHTAEDLEEAS